MTYDPTTLNASGLWRARIHCVRALSAIDDSLQGMLLCADDNKDDPTARAMLTGAQRSVLELVAHFEANYDVCNRLDGQGRGSLEPKEGSPCFE